MEINDPVLESFLSTAKSNNIDLSEDFLRQIYDIEKEYQYRDKSDRGVAYREIQKAIEEYISSNKAKSQ